MSASRTIIATMHKEWLLLRRDRGGLLMLLVMPAALIIIMALVQDAPFRDYQKVRFDLLLADEDGGALASEIKTGLRQSQNFHLIDSMDGKPVNGAALTKVLQKGTYHVGIIIPKGATAEVANSANIIANTLATQLGTGRLPERAPRDTVAIRLYFDPVSRPAFRLAIRAALDKYITAASSRLLVMRISRMAGSNSDTTNSKLQKLTAGIGIQESMLNGKDNAVSHINSVQHNVPAWAIFGMFFIVVPLSGHIIREREDGSALRVRLIPGAERGVSIGRILFNTLICCVQFVLMCAVGRWLLPYFGLPALTLGAHPFALIPVVLATAVCATAFGYLIGAMFRSYAQALPFSSIAIVILSALGGIWVPVELLPPVLQATAKISPLHWSLQGVQAIILRDGNWSDVMIPVFVLIALAIALWGVGLLRRRMAEGLF
jgi:ABC-2 type transport system permease protein